MRLDLLKSSCRRLPELVESEAPTNLLLNEVRILMGLAMQALDEAEGRCVEEQSESMMRRQAAKTIFLQRPKRVRMLETVMSEIQMNPPLGPILVAVCGAEYPCETCETDPLGAVFVRLPDGLLGVKPGEFEVVEWEEEDKKAAEAAEEGSEQWTDA